MSAAAFGLSTRGVADIFPSCSYILCYSDVTSDQTLLTINIYDRNEDDQHFLGMVEIKPVLKHDHSVDQWYK